jgi:hypothetical protein
MSNAIHKTHSSKFYFSFHRFEYYRKIILGCFIPQNFTYPKSALRACVPRSRGCTAKLCDVPAAALGTNTYVLTSPQREMIIEGRGEEDGS